MANSIDPDEMARYEPSHLDLCCLQISVKASLGMNELTAAPDQYFAVRFRVDTVRQSVNKYSFQAGAQ